MIFRHLSCSKKTPNGQKIADYTICSNYNTPPKDTFSPDSGFVFGISVQDLALNPSLLKVLNFMDIGGNEYRGWLDFQREQKEASRVRAVDFFRIYLTNMSQSQPILKPEDILFIFVLCPEKQKEILKILDREYDPFDEKAAANYAAFRATLVPIKQKIELHKHLAQ